MSKTFNRISDLRKEIQSLKKSISPAEEAAKEVKAELEAAESKLTLVDGEPVLGENPVRLNRLKSRAEKAKEELVSLQESLEAKEALLARAIDENEVIYVKLVIFDWTAVIWVNFTPLLRAVLITICSFYFINVYQNPLKFKKRTKCPKR